MQWRGVYKSDWTELVSKKVRYDMKSTERTKKKMLLPTTEDFVKFSGFIRQKMIQACEEVKINASPKRTDKKFARVYAMHDYRLQQEGDQ